MIAIQRMPTVQTVGYADDRGLWLEASYTEDERHALRLLAVDKGLTLPYDQLLTQLAEAQEVLTHNLMENWRQRLGTGETG